MSYFKNMTLGMIIKTAIQRKGKTQAWLAQKLECSQMSVYRLCNDINKPKNKTLTDVSVLLELPQELLERAMQKTPYKPSASIEYQTVKRVLEQIAVENPLLSVADREALLKASLIIASLL